MAMLPAMAFLDLAQELRRVDDFTGLLFAQPRQQVDITGTVEGILRALARGAAQARQLGIGEVVAIHGQDDGMRQSLRADMLKQRLRQRGLAAAGRPAMPSMVRRPLASRAASLSVKTAGIMVDSSFF
jgi:hypothetical protein